MKSSSGNAPSLSAAVLPLCVAVLFTRELPPDPLIFESLLVLTIGVASQRIVCAGLTALSGIPMTRAAGFRVFVAVPALILSCEWLRRYQADGPLFLLMSSTLLDVGTTKFRSMGHKLASASFGLVSHAVIALAALSAWGIDPVGEWLIIACSVAGASAALDFARIADEKDPMMHRATVVLAVMGPALLSLLTMNGLLPQGYFLTLLSGYSIWRSGMQPENSLRSATRMYHLLFALTLVALRLFS